MKNKRFVIAILMAWILFIGVDFLFHASILSSLWKKDVAIFKSIKDLAILIPVGYFSFLLLTALIGYFFFRIFKTKPAIKEILIFALIFAVLFTLSNLAYCSYFFYSNNFWNCNSECFIRIASFDNNISLRTTLLPSQLNLERLWPIATTH